MKRYFEKTSEDERWFQWCRDLLELYTTQKQFMLRDKSYRTSFSGMKQWILAHDFKGKDFLYATLLLDAILSAESTPGAGPYVPWFIYNNIQDPISTRANSGLYLKYTLERTTNDFAKEIFSNIHAISGPLTSIRVKPSDELDVIIRPRNSFDFSLKLNEQFLRMVGSTSSIELINPISIMIEGAPETIGEINSLLEYNHETKRPIILVARNFPEEIIATLATNWVRNSLTILPFVYGDTLETINLAADFCSITKGELISPHFGDVISAVIMDRDKWGTLEKIVYTDSRLSLYKNVDVSNHVRTLIKKSKEADSQDLVEILNDRILSLSNDALEVWLPKDNSNLIEELESLIKHYGAFVTSGFVNTPIGVLPKSFVDVAQSSAQSFKEEILNIGGFLLRANDEMVVGQK